MVEVTVRRAVELECADADVVERLVVDTERLVRVLDKLVHGESRVVGLDNRVGHLRGRHNGECGHHSVWVFLPNFRDEESSHTCTSTTSERVRDLESLETIASLCFSSDDVEDRVDELGALCVVAFCPVITCTRLTENKVVYNLSALSQGIGDMLTWPEEVAERSGTHSVHGTRLEIYQDGTRHVLSGSSLKKVNCHSHGRFHASLTYLVEVNIHALQL